MSPLYLLALFVAPACSQLVIRLGPVDVDPHSNLEDVALPEGFVMVKSLPEWPSVQQSPMEEMVQQLMTGIQDEEEEPSPEQKLHEFMMNGLQGDNLLRRSRLGLSRPCHEQMFQNVMTNAFEGDNMFSRPSVVSSSFTRTHTISDAEGQVEVKQTQCQDGICITKKSASSTASSINPFLKIKTLRAELPEDAGAAHVVATIVSALALKEDETNAPEIVVKDANMAPPEKKMPAPEKSKKKTLGQDLVEFASSLLKGIEATAGESSKDSTVDIADVADKLKEAVANKFKEEHVMEV